MNPLNFQESQSIDNQANADNTIEMPPGSIKILHGFYFDKFKLDTTGYLYDKNYEKCKETGDPTNCHNQVYQDCIINGGTAANCTTNIRDAYTWCSINDSGNRNQCIENFNPNTVDSNNNSANNSAQSAASRALPSNKITVVNPPANTLPAQITNCAVYAKNNYTDQQLAVSLNLLLKEDTPNLVSITCYMQALNLSMTGCDWNETKCFLEKNENKITEFIGKQETIAPVSSKIPACITDDCPIVNQDNPNFVN